jgi:hypothetical protein
LVMEAPSESLYPMRGTGSADSKSLMAAASVGRSEPG